MRAPSRFVVFSWCLLLPVAFLQAEETGTGPELSLLRTGSSEVGVEWSDPSLKWSLEAGPDLQAWAQVDLPSLERVSDACFRYRLETGAEQWFFRLRETGSARVFVVGDSISALGTWPDLLAQKSGGQVFPQAIGGTDSLSMLHQAKGVELRYPRPGVDPVAAGAVRIRWIRHPAFRSQSASFRNDWYWCPKAVSEPRQIEVYKAGRFIGLATHDTKRFQTDHSNFPKTLFSEAHGFHDGDPVTFLSNDPAYPSNLSTFDPPARWRFSSLALPPAIIERKVYWAANVSPDSFEIRELAGSPATLDLGGDTRGGPVVEGGWFFDTVHSGGAWDVTWKARTKYDDHIWILEVSANDFPGYSASGRTIPNLKLLLSQMTGVSPKFLILCPPSGSYPERDSDSFAWENCYDIYLPWVRANHPNNHIDTMRLMGLQRTQKEKSMLADPEVPELLWLKGTPSDESTWQASAQAFQGASQMWVGPGYIPLQFRASFQDGIHLSRAGNQFIADTVAAELESRGW